MANWTAYNDAASQAIISAFRDRLEPLLAQAAPNWTLHHIKMIRASNFDTNDKSVEIRLVIKPIPLNAPAARVEPSPKPLAAITTARNHHEL